MTFPTKLIVVVGATGYQGGSVVSTYAQDPAWRVRAITRDPSSTKAQALASKYPDSNIELVSADLNDFSSLAKVFDGANAVFGVTDFWTLYYDEKTHAQAAAAGRPANELCFDLELQQGKNIFDAAAQTQGLERLVFSGLSNASKLSGGKYNYVLHFDAKALAVEYGQQTYPELWAKTSVVQVGFYLENFNNPNNQLLTPKKNAEGVFVFNGAGSESRWPMVAAAVETGDVTKALVDLPAGKHVVAYRELVRLEQFVEIWSKTLGIEAKIEPSVVGADSEHIPAELKREFEETFKYAGEFGYWGGDRSVVHPEDIGLKTGTVEEWVKGQDWSSVMNVSAT